MLLQCRAPMQYLWADYGLKIFEAQQDYSLLNPTPQCPPGYEFFQTWFGTFSDILGYYGLSPTNQIHTINRQMHYHNTHNFLDLPTKPEEAVLNLRDLGLQLAPNTILVENGPAWSGQCNHGIGYYIGKLATEFPQFQYLCSHLPGVSMRNVHDGSKFNLLQLSDLSNKCVAFITQASGVNACTYTKHNLGKLRIFFGFNYPYKIWDNAALVVQNYDQLAATLREKLCTK